MKILLAFVFFFSCFFLGYSSGIDQSLHGLEETILEDLASSNQKPFNRNLAYAISVTAEQHQKSQNHFETNRNIEAALETSSQATATMNRPFSDLKAYLGNDSVGTKFNYAFLASTYATEIPGAEAYMKSFWTEQARSPENAINEFQMILGRLPQTGYPLERSSLLLHLSELKTDSEVARLQAITELTQNIIPSRPDASTAQNQEELNLFLSSNLEMMVPISAHLAYLNSTSDRQEALNGTVSGIIAQPDAGVRLALTSQFLQKYPDMEPEFRNALEVASIELHTGNSQ